MNNEYRMLSCVLVDLLSFFFFNTALGYPHDIILIDRRSTHEFFSSQDIVWPIDKKPSYNKRRR